MRRALRWTFDGVTALFLLLLVAISWLWSQGADGYRRGTVFAFVEGERITIDRVTSPTVGQHWNFQVPGVHVSSRSLGGSRGSVGPHVAFIRINLWLGYAVTAALPAAWLALKLEQ